MRKFLALFLILTLALCAVALADHGEADIVASNGEPEHLTLTMIEFAKDPFSSGDEEKLKVTIIGFTEGLLTGQFGEKLEAELFAVCGEEEIKYDSVIDRNDDVGTGIYYIPIAQMPDALRLYPDGETEPITLWVAGDPIPGEEEAEAEADAEADAEANAEANGKGD